VRGLATRPLPAAGPGAWGLCVPRRLRARACACSLCDGVGCVVGWLGRWLAGWLAGRLDAPAAAMQLGCRVAGWRWCKGASDVFGCSHGRAPTNGTL
jgi:hypothetical protein